MSIRIRRLQNLQHSLFQANLLLSQRVNHMNYQLCATAFSADALREATARTREASRDVRTCLDAIAAMLSPNDGATE